MAENQEQVDRHAEGLREAAARIDEFLNLDRIAADRRRHRPPLATLEASQASMLGAEEISYRDVVAEYRQSGDCFLETYCYEQIKTYHMKPGEDLEMCIKLHAKVSLCPSGIYDVSHQLCISSCAYVIGNGAVIRVACDTAPAVKIDPLQPGPSISGMWGVTFVNCKFERPPHIKGVLIRCATSALFHGCLFHGIMGTCLDFSVTSSVKGCQFLACYRAINSSKTQEIKIRHCCFDKCIFGITIRGDFRICSNMANETFCFLHAEGGGLLRNNTVSAPCRWTHCNNFSMVTCASGRVTPLGSVHIVPGRRKPWPVFEDNMFVGARLYLGNRSGLLDMRRCSFFSQSSICVDERVANKLVLSNAFENNVTVCKIIRRDNTPLLKLCLCGSSHYVDPLILTNISSEIIGSRYSFTVDTAEFSSDDEDM